MIEKGFWSRALQVSQWAVTREMALEGGSWLIMGEMDNRVFGDQLSMRVWLYTDLSCRTDQAMEWQLPGDSGCDGRELHLCNT